MLAENHALLTESMALLAMLGGKRKQPHEERWHKSIEVEAGVEAIPFDTGPTDPFNEQPAKTYRIVGMEGDEDE